jgi:hypothetical protein
VWLIHLSTDASALDLYQQDPSLVEALQTVNDLTQSIELVAETWPTASESTALPSTSMCFFIDLWTIGLTAYMNRFKGKFALIAQDRVTMLS